MLGRLTRRKRLLLITVAIGLLFIALMAVVIRRTLKPLPVYLPGEAIEGLTADLARSLPPDYPRVTFVDATEESGIAFQHFYGRRTTQLPEDMGSGAAWGDYDQDGWIDLFVANQAGPLTMTAAELEASPAHCALYHNNGDGTFEEVAAQAGVDFRGWALGAAWGDADNDGWPDLVVTTYGEILLYHNNGDGTFTDLSDQSGLGGRQGFWTGVSWGDFNRDGFLDLYVNGYVDYAYQDPGALSKQYAVEIPTNLNPSSFAPSGNLLYRNNGDGTFTEMAAQAGVENRQGRSLSSSWCDFDDDGWLDLYVANDVSDNVFYRNLGDGTFEEISHASWVADYRGAMGIAVGDWDGDQDLDIFITHWIAQENALYTNLLSQFADMDLPSLQGIRFMDEADRYGLGQIALDYIGWGTSFFDYDNDGRLDLFVANGSTFQQRDEPWRLVPMSNQLFWNRGADHGFYDVSSVSGALFRHKRVSRGAAFADYDNDGDLDIFIVNNGGPGLLMRNDAQQEHQWLQVALEGVVSNRSAIGAKLRLVVGSRVHIRPVGAQG
ncbi:MAG: VCBS repeat-containing protein, partial [Candidatus Marinimicrobia bacterium]|nr:VCBS repeat-containing protein [Candidatus Neomarinimicrobiota bacterium]